MVGLFSVLDVTMDDVLELLPLEPAISDALRTRRGAEGAALGAVMACEQGEGAPDGTEPVTELRAIGAAYREALDWTQTVATRIG